VDENGAFETFASDLGVACGLAFAPDGTLFVGDRSGTVFRVDRHGKATVFASIPPSVAAFHLAMAPDGAVYVTAPTLSAYDAVYRIDADGTVTTVETGFGRPQGIAFDSAGDALVVEALAGASGLYRLRPSQPPEMMLAGPGLIGVAVDPFGGMVVCSNETVYRIPR
jgi:sugar lactone lactonase YvrE